ncbi:MAG: hypothetical protein ABI191_02445 [Rhizomicrobium sp.]
MRPVSDPVPSINTTALIAAAKTRASRKTNPASSLHSPMGEDAHPETRSGKDRRKAAPCQLGTPGNVPFRYSLDAPRLNAAFVAQLLGQMMPDCAARNIGTLAAYEEASSSAQVFDTQL